MSRVANTAQYVAWNEDSGRRWAEDPDRQDKVLAPIADVLVAAAGFTPGEAVLDVGCGCGATTLAAAELVGAPGGVLGLDLSAPMLEVARRRCHERAAANVRFEQADAQTCALPRAAFDVAISRFGTMFFDDPVAAFRNVAGALGRGGRLAIATWQPLVANAWLTVPGAALLRYGTPPATADGASGMFSQSDPSDLAATLTTAGFDAVVSNPVSVTLTLGANATEATEYLTASGPGRAVLETISEADRPTALDEVRAVLAEHAGPRGVSLDAAILLTTATLAG